MLVLAPNRSHMEYLLAYNGYDPKDFKYISSEVDLRGYRGDILILEGATSNPRLPVGLLIDILFMEKEGLVRLVLEEDFFKAKV